MPLAVTLSLKSEAVAGHHLGRGAHALLLRLLAGADPAMARDLHEDEQSKPFTAALLPSMRGQEGYLLRFTALREDIASLVKEKVLSRFPAEIMLGDTSFSLVGEPAMRVESYQNFAAGRLLDRMGLASRLSLSFVTPTTFRSGGHNVPLPLPGLVFGSLLERWNAFAPLTFPPEVRQYAEECLVISRYRLATQMVELGGGKQVGFTGVCHYIATNKDPYWLRVVHLLADFAFYAGVGAKTTMGMGQTRRIDVARPASNRAGYRPRTPDEGR